MQHHDGIRPDIDDFNLVVSASASCCRRKQAPVPQAVGGGRCPGINLLQRPLNRSCTSSSGPSWVLLMQASMAVSFSAMPCFQRRPALAGTVKGLTSDVLKQARCHLILGNTYHLGNRPGADLVELMGGLHQFIDWPRAMLTDSGTHVPGSLRSHPATAPETHVTIVAWQCAQDPSSDSLHVVWWSELREFTQAGSLAWRQCINPWGRWQLLNIFRLPGKLWMTTFAHIASA